MSRPTSLLAGLNPEQSKAVTTTDGPLLVLAGAGSGKTRVITVRIAWLLAHGALPTQLLAMTFTNKAAREMRERVAALVGAERAAELTVGTFHSFCLRLLKEHGGAIGLPSHFAICDSSDQLAAIRGALRELRVAESKLAPNALQSRISLAKNRLQTPKSLRAGGRHEVLVARAWEKYDEQLRRSRQLDFDDLLVLSVKLLKESSATRAALADRFRWLLVDEYQDTNEPQYELLRLIAGEHRNLCVVGDDDQSIYGWRGADVRKILHFERDFGGSGGATVVRLETNYRSTEPILAAANRVIAHNPARHEKTLRSALGPGDPVSVKRVEDETAEAELVGREIADAIRVEPGRASARAGDYAVLFRAATQARPFEAALRSRNLPYKLIGGMSFFDRKEVRDVLAYLRLAANPDDEISLLRVINCPPRGIGKTTIDKALVHATAEGIPVARSFRNASAIAGLPAAAVEAVQGFLALMTRLGAKEPGRDLVAWIHALLKAVDYRGEVERCYPDPATREERWLGVLEVANFAENHVQRTGAPTLRSFLEALALSTDEEDDEEKEHGKNAVTLMTLHAAKGLEFPRVYLVGAEEGLLPHGRAVADETVEEERRLMYVGITRAQRQLTVTCVKSRARAGMRGEAMPSRFLYEMRGEEKPKTWRAWEVRE